MPKKPTGSTHFTEFSKVQIKSLTLSDKNYPNPQTLKKVPLFSHTFKCFRRFSRTRGYPNNTSIGTGWEDWLINYLLCVKWDVKHLLKQSLCGSRKDEIDLHFTAVYQDGLASSPIAFLLNLFKKKPLGMSGTCVLETGYPQHQSTEELKETESTTGKITHWHHPFSSTIRFLSEAVLLTIHQFSDAIWIRAFGNFLCHYFVHITSM